MKQTIISTFKKNCDGISSSWFEIWAIFSLSISSLTVGAAFCWTSPYIPIITSDDYPGNITIDEASYLTIIPAFAAMIFSPFFAMIIDKIGRRYTMLFITIPHLLMWIIIMSTENISLFYLARFIDGIGDACMFSALPMYMGEIASPGIRGTWGNVPTLAIYTGQMLINIVGGYSDIKTSAYVFSVLPILFFCTFWFMPESPYYLIMKGEESEAKKALQTLRRRENVEEELDQLIVDVKRQTSEKGGWKDLVLNPTHRKAFLAGTFIRGAQQFSGISAFSTYTVYIFQQAGVGMSNTICAIIYSFFLAFMNSISSTALDKLGRKRAMIISCAGCTVILLSQVIYFSLQSFTTIDLSSISWFPLAGLIFYVILYSIGLGIVPTLMIGELFSASIKGKGVCALNFSFAFQVIVSTKLFQFLTEEFGLYAPFLLFLVCTFVSTFASYFIVPETKGKTLEEIQQSMK